MRKLGLHLRVVTPLSPTPNKRGWDGKLKRRIPHGEFCSNYYANGDVQQFSRGDKAGNMNDALEFGSWQDENDWKPVLDAV